MTGETSDIWTEFGVQVGVARIYRLHRKTIEPAADKLIETGDLINVIFIPNWLTYTIVFWGTKSGLRRMDHIVRVKGFK